MPCRNCKFWKDEGLRPVPAYSECRRYPPQRYIRINPPRNSDEMMSFVNCQSGPETWPDYECGEFAPYVESP